jgi:nucleoside-diphosphate-sugar epimerase
MLLAEGHEVRVFDLLLHGGGALLSLSPFKGFDFVHGDVCDGCAVKRALEGMHAVVHLAAIVGDPACAQQPDYARAVNEQGSLNLINMARSEGIGRFVFASTCSNYGRMADTSELATEETELRPVSLYAHTKVAVEQDLLSSPGQQLSCTVLRFATLYGLSPRMRFDLTVNEFVKDMLVNRHLVVFGEQCWRPYVHVRDAAAAIRMVLGAPAALVDRRVFNVGDTQENYRKLDLVRMMKSRLGDIPVDFVHRAEDPRDYRVSFDSIASTLGFQVTRRVPDGIGEVAFAIEHRVVDDLQNRRYYNS